MVCDAPPDDRSTLARSVCAANWCRSICGGDRSWIQLRSIPAANRHLRREGLPSMTSSRPSRWQAGLARYLQRAVIPGRSVPAANRHGGHGTAIKDGWSRSMVKSGISQRFSLHVRPRGGLVTGSTIRAFRFCRKATPLGLRLQQANGQHRAARLEVGGINGTLGLVGSLRHSAHVWPGTAEQHAGSGGTQCRRRRNACGGEGTLGGSRGMLAASRERLASDPGTLAAGPERWRHPGNKLWCNYFNTRVM